MTPYTLKESIKLIKDRMKCTRENFKAYKRNYEDACRMYDIEKAEKFFRWMMQEKSTLTELEYLYNTITGKEIE